MEEEEEGKDMSGVRQGREDRSGLFSVGTFCYMWFLSS